MNIELDDCYMLGRNFHLNKFRAIFEKSPKIEPKGEDESDDDFATRVEAANTAHASSVSSIKENLFITQDGTIIAIRKEAADPFLKDPDVDAVRWNRRKIPAKLLMENSDDLYKLLAAVIPLDETVNYG